MSKPSKRIVVYTCIIAGYDDLKPPREIDPSISYICFSDDVAGNVGSWDIRPLPKLFNNPIMENRYVKMHPHLLFPDHDASIYIDGNIEIVAASGELDLFLRSIDADIAMYKHPFRNCIYEEANACSELGHDWNWRIQAQMNTYRANGFPKNFGLFECNVIFRRHNNSGVELLMDAWWETFRSGIKRDQLSLVYLAWKWGVPIASLGISDPRNTQRLFSMRTWHKAPVSRLTQTRSFVNKSILRCQGAKMSYHGN